LLRCANDVRLGTPRPKNWPASSISGDRLLALIGDYDDLDAAFLNIKYCIRRLPLEEDDLILLNFLLFCPTRFLKKVLWIKRDSA
jgi:hypothetical protein